MAFPCADRGGSPLVLAARLGSASSPALDRTLGAGPCRGPASSVGLGGDVDSAASRTRVFGLHFGGRGTGSRDLGGCVSLLRSLFDRGALC